ncbi:ETS homologous factor-like isoform X2 [Bombyx mandarina]|uniref:Transcription factor BmEts n=2 Tax=Bombyx TaxID=7090 RepID=Q7YT29_BOMMO|nr:transcription factor Ets [Bombyx mori]XP_028036966.1 ETS homologous factor-like isoform X1 [Bombyx mandarina]XP_028036967.1 ETS homologous factor-like isoform X2 [Bombyx mandarina]BAC79385.1 transcription factor BmEts [Bombyx mori]
MIDYARPFEQSTCDIYYTQTTSAPTRLDDFQVFRRGNASHIYGNYYSNPSYDAYEEPEIENAANVYHTLVSCREYHRDDWKYKVVVDWTEDDTVSWIVDTAQSIGISEYDIPFFNYRVTGLDLRNMKREDFVQRMAHPSMDPVASRKIGDNIFDRLHTRLNEDMFRQSSIFRYAESEPYHHEQQTMLDLDAADHKNRMYASDYKPNDQTLLQGPCDSSDDAEDVFRSEETASPEYSYGSDVSKSGDEDDKRKMSKRPPGRPRGSGRKTSIKRPRSVSVPEFLRNLLFDPKYCPSIIKWEDYALGKFRFVKPDEVAKLWGKMKQNDNMTFEKFSRAMRYHYRQSVLVSVPTARLVYQFGPKGPDIKTDNPNFIKVKSENEQENYNCVLNC